MGNIAGTKRGPYKNKKAPVKKSVNKKELDLEDYDPKKHGEPDSESKTIINERMKRIDEVPGVTKSNAEEDVIETTIPNVSTTTTESSTISEEKKIEEEKAEEERKYNNWKDEYTDVTPRERKKEDVKEVYKEGEEDEDEEEKKPRKKREKKVDPEQELRDSNAMLINGTMLIAFCDFFFPSIMKIIFVKVLKDPRAKKVKHTDVCLNSDQVESLGAVSDNVAKVLFEKLPPLVLFFVGMSVMYAMNFKFALEEIDKEK